MIITNGYEVLVFFALAILAMIAFIVVRKGNGVFHDSEFGEECAHEVKPAEPAVVESSKINNLVSLNERENTASGVTSSQYRAWKNRHGRHDVTFIEYKKMRAENANT